MRRRKFLIGVGAAAMASATADAQRQSAVPVIGFLNSASPATFANYIAAFRHGLQETGYVEGQNVAIEFRWAEGQDDRLTALAADLVGRQVSVIAATGGPVSASAAKAATSTTPIVFMSGGDPVKRGLVASLGHPGGNATGYNLIAAELDGKRIGLLHDVVPAVGHLAVLLNPKNPNFLAQKQDVEAAANTLGLQLSMLEATNPGELETVLVRPRFGEAGALLVGADPFFNSRRARIVELVAGLSVPAIYEWREFVDAGGLMSYGPSLADGYRQVGVYVGRILKGEKPADLPVIQPTRFELVINQKIAKALGLAVSPLLLSEADEVIEWIETNVTVFAKGGKFVPRPLPVTIAIAVVVALLLGVGGCTNFPDPANRAAVDGVLLAAAGALVGGTVAGPAAIPVGLLVGAGVGGVAGALTPPSPYQLGPTYPW